MFDRGLRDRQNHKGLKESSWKIPLLILMNSVLIILSLQAMFNRVDHLINLLHINLFYIFVVFLVTKSVN